MVFYQLSDGRAFTDYTPNCIMQNEIKKQNNINNNYEYKLFLQRNAEQLMKKNAINAFTKSKLDCDCQKCSLRLSKQ